MRLFAGELRRVLARRMLKVLSGLALASVALVGVVTFLGSEDVSPAQLAARQEAARQKVAACLASPAPIIEGRQPGGPQPGGPQPDSQDRTEFCRLAVGGIDDPRFALQDLKGILQGTTAPLVVVAWLIGASVIGSDWQSRTVTTLLTWEPRRARVLLVKALASILVASAFALLVQALLGAAVVPAALLRGTTDGTGGSWLASVLGVLLRGTALIAIATAVGFSVASIGRNTSAALGIGFAYFVVIENVVGSLLEDFRRWLLLGNAIVLVSGRDGAGEVFGRSVVAASWPRPRWSSGVGTSRRRSEGRCRPSYLPVVADGRLRRVDVEVEGKGALDLGLGSGVLEDPGGRLPGGETQDHGCDVELAHQLALGVAGSELDRRRLGGGLGHGVLPRPRPLEDAAAHHCDLLHRLHGASSLAMLRRRYLGDAARSCGPARPRPHA